MAPAHGRSREIANSSSAATGDYSNICHNACLRFHGHQAAVSMQKARLNARGLRGRSGRRFSSIPLRVLGSFGRTLDSVLIVHNDFEIDHSYGWRARRKRNQVYFSIG